MRYLIDEEEIRAENTAKPYTQKSTVVDKYLYEIEGQPDILDFGCGKLRYSDTLRKVSGKLTFVDSDVQLCRLQMVREERTSVGAYIKNYYQGALAISFEELSSHDDRYDVITCTNVLSAIPCSKTITVILEHFARLVKSDGKIVIVNQYRSSAFKKYESGSKWLYGYKYHHRRGVSYYGILDKTRIEDLLTGSGFHVLKSWCVGEIVFTEARL